MQSILEKCTKFNRFTKGSSFWVSKNCTKFVKQSIRNYNEFSVLTKQLTNEFQAFTAFSQLFLSKLLQTPSILFISFFVLQKRYFAKSLMIKIICKQNSNPKWTFVERRHIFFGQQLLRHGKRFEDGLKEKCEKSYLN